jgi:hypothetical protein
MLIHYRIGVRAKVILKMNHPVPLRCKYCWPNAWKAHRLFTMQCGFFLKRSTLQTIANIILYEVD